MRGFAILLVLVCHSSVDYRPWHGVSRVIFYLASFGGTGVHLFYVLSGFLISGILLDAREKPDYFKRFYFRRALRILPAYLLILTVLISLRVVSWRFVLACLLYVANMAGIVGARTGEYGVFWSLAVEEQFYLAWPVVIRRFQPRNVFRFIVLVCVACPLIRYAAAAQSSDAYYKLWDNADYLMYGALVALLLRTRSLSDRNARPVYRTLFAVGLAFTAAVIWLHPADLSSSPSDALWSALGRLPFILVFVAMLVYVVAGNDGVPKPAMQPLYFLGYISYGLYLVHQLIFGLYDGLAGPPIHGFGAIVLRDLIVVAISIGIAWLSRVYFEEPFLRRKNRLSGSAVHAHS